MNDKKAIVANHPTKETILDRMDGLRKEYDHLSVHLRASILIEAIWCQAFDHGSVRFSGTQRHVFSNKVGCSGLAFTSAWFINSKEKFFLTADELLKFKPEALVHPDFIESTKAWNACTNRVVGVDRWGY